MVLLCKTNALYVKCCIIPNGITDSQGDTLYAEDIKKIFTSFNNQDNFEIYHNDIPVQEVSLLENYISTADEMIGTNIVPKGSWMAVVRVDNPDIKQGLLTGEFKGVSLNNRIAEPCKANLHGIIRYKDVADAECIIPLLISFVEAGANGYGLLVMDYDAYIKKGKDVSIKKGVQRMDFKEFMEGLKSLIKQAEDTPEEEPAVEKEEAQEEKPAEEVIEDEKPAEEEPAVEKEETVEEEEVVEEEPEIEKEDSETEAEEETEDDNGLEERIAKLEEIVAKLVEEPEEEEVENPNPEDEPVDEDTPKITKSEKVVIEDISTPQQSNYYEMTGRDPLTGKKLKK